MKQYEKAAIERLNRAHFKDTRDLYSVYANPSQEKREAWQDIVDRANACHGVATVLSYNAQVFTAAIFWHDVPSDHTHGMYITKEHIVVVDLFNNNITASL